MDNKSTQTNNNLLDIVANTDNRIDWNTYFMSMAILISKRSPCKRLNVGCVIVNDNRVITTGYNGFIKNCPHISKIRDGHEQMTVHAEQNAVCDAAQRGVSLKNSKAFITHFPCINCCKVLISSGIKEIIYLNNYKNDELVSQLSEQSNISITLFNSL